MTTNTGKIDSPQIPSRSWSEHEKKLLQEILGMNSEDVERLLCWVTHIRQPAKQTLDAIANDAAIPLRDA